ncbi:MAG TPA: hypothetical protein VFD59_16825 [Nocardioidaceae bacterium]|nr:hypothetical protein [Nocardioidaceae bacterium]
MFNAADYYLASEMAYRRERATRGKVVNERRRSLARWNRHLRLPKQPHLSLPLPKSRRGDTVVA